MAEILVVDDVENIRMAIKFALESQNHTVAMAENGEEAIEILKQIPFDLVITDILMPHSDGIDLIRYIKDNSEKSIPVIAISGGGHTASYQEVLAVAKTYVSTVLEKPFSKDLLLQSVDALLNQEASVA